MVYCSGIRGFWSFQWRRQWAQLELLDLLVTSLLQLFVTCCPLLPVWSG
jgi:hypothetical protein